MTKHIDVHIENVHCGHSLNICDERGDLPFGSAAMMQGDFSLFVVKNLVTVHENTGSTSPLKEK